MGSVSDADGGTRSTVSSPGQPAEDTPNDAHGALATPGIGIEIEEAPTSVSTYFSISPESHRHSKPLPRERASSEMENLLSVAFDNLSSRDSNKIRKGCRQVENLLAQILLSKPNSRSPHKRKSSVLNDTKQQGTAKQLGELKQDPAFCEFFRLQEGFQYNVASRLMSTLEVLMGMGNPSSTDLLILSALDLLQGVLLLHPPSKCLFHREIHMNMLLDLLDASNPPKIQSHALLVLVTALLGQPQNTRTFEAIDGLLTVTSLFKSRSTTKDVKMRSLEFLYFYLMPEVPMSPLTSASAPNTAMLGRNGADKHELLANHGRTHSGEMDIDEENPNTRSTENKQKLLGRYLSNVAELVGDLEESAPFSAIAV